MIVGIFSPVINWCGGAEWVAIDIINVLKEQGHKVIVLSDRPLDQDKFKRIFNREVQADQQLIFPLKFFSSTDLKNVYSDAIRSLTLKSKCDILIDTFSNAILPGGNVFYIHHPLLKRLETGAPYFRNKVYFSPYKYYLRYFKRSLQNKLILANSEFTARAIEIETGMKSHVLYPPVISEISPQERNFEAKRPNNVITVARICKGKNLNVIPYIASATRKDISFTIAGLLESQEVLISLQKLIKALKVSNRIEILTNVKRKQLRTSLLNSKVYLHPKVNEHFGVSIVEAMCLGCTPVVHDSGGPMEFVSQDFRYKSIEEAAEKVERAVDSWSSIQAREISNYAEKFNEKNFSTQFIEIFNSHFK